MINSELEKARDTDQTFKLGIRLCAVCGKRAEGMHVVATGVATIYTDIPKDVEYQFNGHTDLEYPGRILINDKDQVLVSCKKGHMWFTDITPAGSSRRPQIRRSTKNV